MTKASDSVAMASSCAAASPHHQLDTAGRISVSSSSARAMPGRKPWIAGDSRNPAPGTLDTITLPARIASSSPGTPMVESLRSSSGSQNTSSSRRRITSTRSSPPNVFR
ncbi:hypothetical protein D3C85_1339790 [compost metagenome]